MASALELPGYPKQTSRPTPPGLVAAWAPISPCRLPRPHLSPHQGRDSFPFVCVAGSQYTEGAPKCHRKSRKQEVQRPPSSQCWALRDLEKLGSCHPWALLFPRPLQPPGPVPVGSCLNLGDCSPLLEFQSHSLPAAVMTPTGGCSTQNSLGRLRTTAKGNWWVWPWPLRPHSQGGLPGEGGLLVIEDHRIWLEGKLQHKQSLRPQNDCAVVAAWELHGG